MNTTYFDMFLPHLGHSLHVNARGVTDTVPGSEHVGMRLDALVLHCQECDRDIALIPTV